MNKYTFSYCFEAKSKESAIETLTTYLQELDNDDICDFVDDCRIEEEVMEV